jgi:hypothetical protein
MLTKLLAGQVVATIEDESTFHRESTELVTDHLFHKGEQYDADSQSTDSTDSLCRAGPT